MIASRIVALAFIWAASFTSAAFADDTTSASDSHSTATVDVGSQALNGGNNLLLGGSKTNVFDQTAIPGNNNAPCTRTNAVTVGAPGVGAIGFSFSNGAEDCQKTEELSIIAKTESLSEPLRVMARLYNCKNFPRIRDVYLETNPEFCTPRTASAVPAK